MPAASPEAWALARHQWESDPNVTITDVANSLGVSIPTVSIRRKREMWVRLDHVDIGDVGVDPLVVAQQAIQRLQRLMLESKDENIVLKAARELLDRTMGKPQPAPELPPGAPATSRDAALAQAAMEFPDWAKRPQPGSYRPELEALPQPPN